VSSGFANVALTSAVPTQLADQSVSGMLDTEMRLSYNVVPGRLILLATGTIPSGMKTLAQDELFLLGPLSSDIIGFSAPTLGSGGGVGGGFAFAMPGRYRIDVIVLWDIEDMPFAVRAHTDVWVDFPVTRSENEVARHLMTEEVGKLIAGGDPARFQHAAEVISAVIDEHEAHPACKTLRSLPRLGGRRKGRGRTRGKK